MKKTAIAAALLLAATGAQAATYDILGGSFEMAGVGGDPAIAGGGVMTDGDVNSDALSDFIFFGQPVNTYYLDTGPTVDLAGSDMAGFTAFWNGTEFNQGADPAATVDNGDGTLTLSWSSLIVGGPFDGFTGSWTMDIQEVPVPAAVWLFGSGLLGLVGVARRRKAA